MSNQPRAPYVIVVGVDFEHDGRLAFDEAVKIAVGRAAAEIHLLHVDRTMGASQPGTDKDAGGVSPASAHADTIFERLETLAIERIDAVLADEPDLTFNRVVLHFRAGQPAKELVQLAVDLDADLIVVGTHNRKGLKRLVLGSVAEKVVHHASCPVQVVREKDHRGEVPEIEPLCDACMQTRKASKGAEMWCARHALARHRPRIHKVMRGAGTRSEPEPWSQATPQV